MATPVSIAIRRDIAQVRIRDASVTLAKKFGVDSGDLAPRHKQPDIQAVMTLEAIANFLEHLATQPVAQPIAPIHVAPILKTIPPTPAPRKV